MSVLVAARALVDEPDAGTAGLWPRAAALLTRQVLEQSIDSLWALRAPAMRWTTWRAKLLSLPVAMSDADLVADAVYAWHALSAASHLHAHELAPTRAELVPLIEIAGRVEAYVHRVTT